MMSKNFNPLKKNFALMPIFCQKTSILSKTRRSQIIFFSKINWSHAHIMSKKVYSLKKTAITCLLFEIFIKNNNTFMPKSGLKNVNSVKTILSYGPKKLKWSLSFPILNEKATLFKPILCWKNVHSIKSTMHLCQYFVKSTSIFSKLWCSHVIVSIIP